MPESAELTLAGLKGYVAALREALGERFEVVVWPDFPAKTEKQIARMEGVKHVVRSDLCDFGQVFLTPDDRPNVIFECEFVL